MTDNQKREMLRLVWKAGHAATGTEEKERIEKAIKLALLEGWDAEDANDIDHSYATGW